MYATIITPASQQKGHNRITAASQHQGHNAKLSPCQMKYINQYFVEKSDEGQTCKLVVEKLYLLDPITFCLPEGIYVGIGNNIMMLLDPDQTYAEESLKKIDCDSHYAKIPRLVLPSGTRVAHANGLPTILSADLEVIVPSELMLRQGTKYALKLPNDRFEQKTLDADSLAYLYVDRHSSDE